MIDKDYMKNLKIKADKTVKQKNLYGLSEEEAKQYGFFKVISIDEMDEDPDNRSIYGDDYNTDGLAEAIKNHGFKGAVIVYPFKGRYRIQSGHRTVEAAKKAGKNEISVIVTEAPKNEIERRKQLIVRNLNGREYTPVIMAREVQYLYDTYKMEREALDTRPSGAIRDLVARDIGISAAAVERYRSLLRLNKNLLALIDEDKVPWNVLTTAATLSGEQQDFLFKRLSGKLKTTPSGYLLEKDVKEEIKIARMYNPDGTKYEYDRADISLLSQDLQDRLTKDDHVRVKRRINSMISVRKSMAHLQDALDDTAFIKTKDKEDYKYTLAMMKDMIEQEIRKLDDVSKKPDMS